MRRMRQDITRRRRPQSVCHRAARAPLVRPVASTALRKSAGRARYEVPSSAPGELSPKQLHPKDLSDICGRRVRFALSNILLQKETV